MEHLLRVHVPVVVDHVGGLEGPLGEEDLLLPVDQCRPFETQLPGVEGRRYEAPHLLDGDDLEAVGRALAVDGHGGGQHLPLVLLGGRIDHAPGAVVLLPDQCPQVARPDLALQAEERCVLGALLALRGEPRVAVHRVLGLPPSLHPVLELHRLPLAQVALPLLQGGGRGVEGHPPVPLEGELGVGVPPVWVDVLLDGVGVDVVAPDEAPGQADGAGEEHQGGVELHADPLLGLEDEPLHGVVPRRGPLKLDVVDVVALQVVREGADLVVVRAKPPRDLLGLLPESLPQLVGDLEVLRGILEGRVPQPLLVEIVIQVRDAVLLVHRPVREEGLGVGVVVEGPAHVQAPGVEDRGDVSPLPLEGPDAEADALVAVVLRDLGRDGPPRVLDGVGRRRLPAAFCVGPEDDGPDVGGAGYAYDLQIGLRGLPLLGEELAQLGHVLEVHRRLDLQGRGDPKVGHRADRVKGLSYENC